MRESMGGQRLATRGVISEARVPTLRESEAPALKGSELALPILLRLKMPLFKPLFLTDQAALRCVLERKGDLGATYSGKDGLLILFVFLLVRIYKPLLNPQHLLLHPAIRVG